MGLLDTLDDPTTALAMGLLSAAGPSSKPVSLGQAMGAGYGQYQQARELQQQMLARKQAMQMQQMQVDEFKRKQAEEQQMRQALQSAYLTPQQQAIGAGGPTQAAADMIPQLKPTIDMDAAFGNLFKVNPMAAIELQQKLAKDVKYHVVDGNLVRTGDGAAKSVFSSGKEQTELGKLMAKRDSLPDGHPDRAILDSAIKKATTHPAAASANVYNLAENEQAKTYGKALGDMRATLAQNAFSAPARLASLDRMEQLLQGVAGGKLAPSGVEIASAANSIGFKIDPKLGNKEAAEALAIEMATSYRQPGSGTFTDKDFEAFMKRVPSLSKSAEGRAEITATMRAALKRDIGANQIARAYAAKRGGSIDDGLADELAAYYAQNPVVATNNGAGGFKIIGVRNGGQ